MLRSKRKLLISVLILVFVVLSSVAMLSIALALTQQTINTTINMTFYAQDIDGSVSGSYSIGGETKSLTPNANADHISDNSLLFKADDQESVGGSLDFPAGTLKLTDTNRSIVIQYKFKNFGSAHYSATLNFDSEFISENMKMEYGILDSTTGSAKYSDERYAVIVAGDKPTAEVSYWIKITVVDLNQDASFIGDFIWNLEKCNEADTSYSSLSALEFTGSNGAYSASVSNAGGLGKTGQIVFPDQINGNPVTKISSSSLTTTEKNKVTSVYIPDSVTTIGSAAFHSFESLQTVTFEENIQAGQTSVQSLTGLQTIENDAFYSCSALANFVLPNNCISVGTRAFMLCESIKYLDLSNLTTIGRYAFLGCSYLGYGMSSDEVIYINAETIGEGAFVGCINLKYVKMSGFTSLGDYAFSGCISLINISIIDKACEEQSTSTTVSIGSYAFAYCESLAMVDMNCSYISSYMFYNCTNLSEINSNTSYSNATSIKSYAFSGSGLGYYDIPDSVTTIEDFAFERCYSLTNITIPESVTSIGYGVFKDDGNLTTVTVDSANSVYAESDFGVVESDTGKLIIGDRGLDTLTLTEDTGITEIADFAFSGSLNLVTVNMYTHIEQLGIGVFSGCLNLATIDIDYSYDNERWMIDTFEDCSVLIDTNQNLVKAVLCGGNTDIHLGFNYDMYLEDYLFSGSQYLSSVTIDSTSYNLVIGKYLFDGCYSLKNVSISGYLEFGNAVFKDCDLNTIEINDDNNVYVTNRNNSCLVNTETNTMIATIHGIDMLDLAGQLDYEGISYYYIGDYAINCFVSNPTIFHRIEKLGKQAFTFNSSTFQDGTYIEMEDEYLGCYAGYYDESTNTYSDPLPMPQSVIENSYVRTIFLTLMYLDRDWCLYYE